MKVGVLALQGAFIEHIEMLSRLGVEAVEVRLPEGLADLGGLIIPGGESTAIGGLATRYGFIEGLKGLAESGFPIWGTCAGMILLAKEIEGYSQPLVGAMDIVVERNAFGRQLDSFQVELPIPALDGVASEVDKGRPFPCVFIRAPAIKSVGKGVEVLTALEGGTIVAAGQENLLATAFHPELTADSRFHRYFLRMVRG